MQSSKCILHRLQTFKPRQWLEVWQVFSRNSHPLPRLLVSAFGEGNDSCKSHPNRSEHAISHKKNITKIDESSYALHRWLHTSEGAQAVFAIIFCALQSWRFSQVYHILPTLRFTEHCVIACGCSFWVVESALGADQWQSCAQNDGCSLTNLSGGKGYGSKQKRTNPRLIDRLERSKWSKQGPNYKKYTLKSLKSLESLKSLKLKRKKNKKELSEGHCGQICKIHPRL